MCLRERDRKGGIDEDVGIKTDRHRSCISSREKARTAAPHGRPCAITSMGSADRAAHGIL
jgi:hypothetical protein